MKCAFDIEGTRGPVPTATGVDVPETSCSGACTSNMAEIAENPVTWPGAYRS